MTTTAPTASTPAASTPSRTAPRTLPAIRRAVMRAMLAPSTHNTQPWRFVAGPSVLDLFTDPTRALTVIDPGGRQQTISCGAALLGARLSLAAEGAGVTVSELPDPADPDHLARLTVTAGGSAPDADAGRLDRAADQRHTNRRAFDHEPVAPAVIARLQAAAQQEGTFLVPLTEEPGRSLVAALTAEAEGLLFGSPAYRAELRDWAGRPGDQVDGIPAASIPAAGRVSDRLPTRGLDQYGTGRLPAGAGAADDACLLLLATGTDDPHGWLAAGQALGRILLELTTDNLVAGLYTQLTEIPRIRDQVRSVTRLVGYPQLLLHVGHAVRTPPTPRRSVPDVLTVVADPA